MFDVGFSELVMVSLIALLVIGPERLPKAARIAGFWLGKTRNTIANVKAEIKQELHIEEMRQLEQRQQSIADEFQQIASKTQDEFQQILSRTQIAVDDKKVSIETSSESTTTNEKPV